MADDIFSNAVTMAAYLSAFNETKQQFDAALNPDASLTGQALTDFYTSCRNQALAGDGLKAAFMGTLSTAPTVTYDELLARQTAPDGAMALITNRDALRAALLALGN
jgi:hypothetical protein